MAQRWWERLPAAARREYERSDAISRVPLKPSAALSRDVQLLDAALRGDHREETERSADQLVACICRDLGVPPVAVRVAGERPHDRRGELHGLYRSSSGPTRDTITVWMRTAKRHEVVASRTFLRTLLHEVCHHLDICLFELPSSYHSTGFYRRESSLFRAVVRGTALEAATRLGRTGDREVATRLRDARDNARDEEVDGIALLRAAALAIQGRATPRRD
jgi:hypothetical protein